MNGSRASAAGYRVVCEGPVGKVRLAPPAWQEYRQVIEGEDRLSVQRATHLGRCFTEYCANVQPRLSPEKFKKEGNYPDGHGGTVAIWEFKAWQWRLYGATVRVAGQRCFVGVRVDPSKKRNKADQAMLKSAALDIGNLIEYAA
jgi:hypothetical protein